MKSVYPYSSSILEFLFLGIKPFKCDLCTKAFSRKSHLDRHNLMHSAPSNERPFVCECGLSFTALSVLTAHIRNSCTAGDQELLSFIFPTLSLLILFASFLVSVLCFFFVGSLSKVIALPVVALSRS